MSLVFEILNIHKYSNLFLSTNTNLEAKNTFDD